MGNNDRALLLLLRMAVREEVVDLPADIDWREIKEWAFSRQGVGGIVFDVVEKLPAGQRPPKEGGAGVDGNGDAHGADV